MDAYDIQPGLPTCSSMQQGVDVRHPTRELTRAAALRARRTATARKPPWPVSIDGLATLRGLDGVAEDTIVRSKGKCPLTS